MKESRWQLSGIILLVLFVQFSSFSLAQVVINEVMYNPERCPDADCEWIELYNNGPESADLSSCNLKGENFKVKLSGILESGNYLVLARDINAFAANFESVPALELSFGSGLRNGGDKLILDGADFCDDIFDYTLHAGNKLANGNDKSLEMSANGKWLESGEVGGTPGKMNSNFNGDFESVSDVLENSSSQEENSSSFVQENCDIKISVEMPSAEMNNVNFSVIAVQNPKKTIDETINEETNSINFKTQKITVRGEVKNSLGEIVREYSPWTNDIIASSLRKQYSPNLGAGEFSAHFWIENASCSDYVIENNEAAASFFVNSLSGAEVDASSKSSLIIEKIYGGKDEVFSWGAQFSAKIAAYKGDENKEVISLWVETNGTKVSFATKANLHNKNQDYTLTLPVQLKLNCDHKFSDGDYLLVLEGLDKRTSKKIAIKGNDYCEEQDGEDKSLSAISAEKKENFSFQFFNLPSSSASGRNITFSALLKNGNGEHRYRVWSYAYRGNKCYSCLDSTKERNASIQEVTLLENEAASLPFTLTLDEGTGEGEYKIKIKVLKNDLKTEKEITGSIFVSSSSSPSKENLFEASSLPLKQTEQDNSLPANAYNAYFSNVEDQDAKIQEGKNQKNPEKNNLEKNKAAITGKVIYESAAEKAKKSIPYFLVAATAVLLYSTISESFFRKKSFFQKAKKFKKKK